MLFQLRCRYCGELYICPDSHMYGGLDVRCVLPWCLGCSQRTLIESSFNDGAELISVPPMSMFEKEGRLYFYRYADCPECRGGGWFWKGQLRYQCQTCRDRYYHHPVRETYIPKVDKLCTAYINKARKTGRYSEEIHALVVEKVRRIRQEMEARISPP